MIPVVGTSTLAVPDPDGDPVVWHFRYLLDEHQASFMGLYDDFNRMLGGMAGKAAQRTRKSLKGKRVKPGQAAGQLEKAARRELSESMSQNPQEYMGFVNKWLDLFLSHWESKNPQKVPAWEKGMLPSKALPFGAKMQMFNLVQQHLHELTGLSAKEAPN